jgi:site-specific DNA-adenine methylase
VQAELAFVVRTLAGRGVQIMASNADTPRVRALYAGMRIDVVKCGRAINCVGGGRGVVDEVIVTAGYEPGGQSHSRATRGGRES